MGKAERWFLVKMKADEGVEIIFHINTTPFIGFKAVSPWGLENIETAPLAEELRKKIEGTPETKPTLPLSGGMKR